MISNFVSIRQKNNFAWNLKIHACGPSFVQIKKML